MVKKSKETKSSNTGFIVGMIILFIVMAVAIYFFNQKAPAEQKVAAMVNGEAISIQELDTQYGRVPKEMQTTFTKKSLLSQMIDRKLLIQMANSKNITVTEDDINEMLTQIKQQLPEDQTLESVLADEKITLDELRVEIHDQLLISKFLQDNVVNNIVVSDEEIVTYVKENLGGLEVTEDTLVQVKKFLEMQKQKEAYDLFMNTTKTNANIQILYAEDIKSDVKMDSGQTEVEVTSKPEKTETKEELKAPMEKNIVECLNSKNAALLGSKSCVFTNKQLTILGEDASKVMFVECNSDKGYITKECQDLGIEAYPTWSINGKLFKGTRTIEQLKEISGC